MYRHKVTGPRPARRRRVIPWASLLMCLVMMSPTAGAIGRPVGGAVTAPPANDPEYLLHVASAAALQRNVRFHPAVIYPSLAYQNPYLRDSFWAAQAMQDRRFAVQVLNAFATNERADGDPPTWFYIPYLGPHYHEDESAALVLIWAWRNQVLYGVAPPRRTLQGALSYLLSRTHDGSFVTPAGHYGSWWDAYWLPGATTFAYNQGLYVVALRCAQRFRLKLPPHAIAKGELVYRELYNGHYLRMSTIIPATDASALTGEFLSIWLFHRPMLSDDMVLNTLRHLSPFGAGYRVVALPESTPQQGVGFPTNGAVGVAGDYQNAASWLLYDALSITAAGLHGLPDAIDRLRARLALEFRHGAVLHEYLETNPDLPYYGAEPPWRDHFSWDTFVLVIDRVMHAYLQHQPLPQ